MPSKDRTHSAGLDFYNVYSRLAYNGDSVEKMKGRERDICVIIQSLSEERRLHPSVERQEGCGTLLSSLVILQASPVESCDFAADIRLEECKGR